MKYTVSVNEASKTVVVNLGGYEGVAKCCDTDKFCLSTGIELALERAKVAKAEAEKPKSSTAKSGDVMELVRALEKALPKGQMVVVGNGDGLTEAQKKWLHSLTDCKGGCACDECDEYEYTQDEYDEAVEEAYNEGYADGAYQAEADLEQCVSNAYDEGYADAMREVKGALDCLL